MRFWSGGGAAMSEGRESTSLRPGSQLLMAPLQVTVLAVWVCVLRRDASSYERVLELLQTVSRAAPGLVSYRHLAKLQLGLKAKMILEMFQKGCRLADIRTQLGRLFPLEDPPHSSETTVADTQKVRGIQEQFRELVLHLLRDPSFRTSFLQDEGQNHYGEGFMTALDKLLWEFLLRVGETQVPPRLQPCRADEELPVLGALSQLPAGCLQLLLSSLGSTHSLHPGTPLVLDPNPPGKGTDSPEGDGLESGGGGVDGQLPRRWQPPSKKMKSRRSLRERRSRHALPPPSRRQYPRAAKKENKAESGCSGPGRLDVPEFRDESDTGVRGPEEEDSCQKTEVISDSEDGDSDLLTTCLRGKVRGLFTPPHHPDPIPGITMRPLRLYQRTKHNTLIPTLLEHLGPSAKHPLDGMPNPGVS